jgi:3-carboxy-cis,cis-muconate cycloisomerase
MHTYGGEGQALSKALARELQLGEMLVPSRVVNDLFVEYIVGISMMAMSIERIAQELYTLMEEEISEVSEVLAKGVVGSSTMPHKVNPKRVVGVIAICTRLRALAAPAMEAGRPSHEGDSASNQILSGVIEDACRLGWELTRNFATLLENLAVHPDRMRKNLAIAGPALASENLMMALAPHTGRSKAHDIIHHVIEDAAGLSIGHALTSDPQIRAHFSSEEIADLLDATAYTGESERMAREAAELSRSLQAGLQQRFI